MVNVLIVVAVFLVLMLAAIWFERHKRKAREIFERIELELHEARMDEARMHQLQEASKK